MRENTVRQLTACIFLWLSAVPDLRTKRIPVWIPAVFLLAAAAADALLPSVSDRRELWAGAVPGAILLMLSFLSRGKIGEGDGICLLVCGLLTGITQTVLIAEIALLLAAAAGAILLLTKRCRAKDQIPFLPFLAAASTVLVLLRAAG